MLFEALYVPDGAEPVPETILDEPALVHYVAGLGERSGDLGAIALDTDGPIGACWLRTFTAEDPGYGWVADDVPELSIAVLDRARNRGLGTVLVEAVLHEAATQGIGRVSLSIDPRSPALRLYRRLGFDHVGWEGTSMTMVIETESLGDGRR